MSDFKHFVKNSGLSEDDKKLWENALDVLDEDGVIIIDEMVGGQEDKLQFLTQLLKMKIDYIKKPNEELLQEILSKEQEDLTPNES